MGAAGDVAAWCAPQKKMVAGDRRYLSPALDGVELNAWFALDWRKVRHQFEKRNFKSDRNPLKDRDISCLEAAFDFGKKPLSDPGRLR